MTITTTSLRLFLFTTALLPPLIATSIAKAGYEYNGTVEQLIQHTLSQAATTMGRFASAAPVQPAWCEGTFYVPRNRTICFNKVFINNLASRVGDAAVAYVVAHEYAHHIQHSVPGMLRSSQGNSLRVELQADCLAGVILATIPDLYFDANDIKEMVATAAIIGDTEYDSADHHGSGEARALALRSGMRFGSTREKDNYYTIFCNQN